jgi:glycolate oxidase subunit GlcD
MKCSGHHRDTENTKVTQRKKNEIGTLQKSALSNVDQLIASLRAVVGPDAVLAEPEELLVYECDGLPHHKYLPRAVVFPSSTEETAELMKVLAAAGVPFTPRGAGTGLSGGALAMNRGVVIELARMRKVLEIDEPNRIAVVQTGVVNLHVSRAVAHLGLHYVPDPSSQPTCTIGGNLAENAGGIHCLKYGTTTDHVLGTRVVLAGGDVVDLGGAGREEAGYDLLGVFVGSEGTFGIATEATLRLVPIPPAVRTLLAEFTEVNDASHAVSAIIAAGVMPAALEMMDREIIRAVEASVFAAGLSLDIGAALLIELDGLEAGIDDEADRVKSICLNFGARTCRSAEDEAERKRLWAARKSAFGAVSRISPDSMIQDAVVPRSRLPEVLADAYRISSKYQLRLANVFHAGDGNLHPLICFDSRDPDQVHRVKEAGRELMETCVRAGGSITGEHGVGFDKRDLLSLIFSENDMDAMLRVRAAFDPTGLCNPGKIIPMLRGCGEASQATSKVQSPKSKVHSEPGAVSLGARASRPQLQGATSQNLYDDLPERQSLSALEGGKAADSKGNDNLSATRDSLFAPLRGDSTKPPYRDWQRRLANSAAPKQLAAVVGDANVLPSPLPDSPAALMITPGSVEEVCQLMKLASSQGWTVVPAGAATWVSAGNPLAKVDLVVSTRRLNRIIVHEPADLITVTEAGVTLEELNRTLATKGQWLPLDPADDGRATVGGVVATGVGGAQQFGYGPPRRHVIGMKVVLADGSLIKVGGRVVKNVAGYDLCKLFTGSYGTLGIIVEVNFKLRPLPFETRTLLAWGARDELLSFGRRVITGRLFPVAAELLSPVLVKEVRPEAKEHLLLLRFAGSEAGVSHQSKTALEFIESHQSINACVKLDDAPIWQSVAAVPLRLSQDIAWRVGLLPADIGRFLERLNEAPETSFEPMWQASLGDGRIRVVDLQAQVENNSDNIDSVGGKAFSQAMGRLERLRALAETFGSPLIIENAPTEIRSRNSSWRDFGSTAGLMQRVKEQLDPGGVFSRW